MGLLVPDEVLTLEQFLSMPEIKPALEFIRGRVIQKVAPNIAHSFIQMEISARLREHALPRHLGRSFNELRCTFGGESIVPDISFIAEDRIPRDAAGRPAENMLALPDLVIEVISPGQTVKALLARLQRCVAKGARLAWLIQPRRTRAFVVRPGRPVEIVEADGLLSGEDVLPGFVLPLADLFGWLYGD